MTSPIDEAREDATREPTGCGARSIGEFGILNDGLPYFAAYHTSVQRITVADLHALADWIDRFYPREKKQESTQ